MDNCRKGFVNYWQLDRAALVSLAVSGLVMVLSVVTLTPAPCLGGERGRERPNRQQVLDILAVRLRLSEQQKVAVAPIFDEEVGKRRELMDRLRVEMERIDRETADRLDEILSTEQMVQYNRILEERRRRGGERQSLTPDQEGAPSRPSANGGPRRLP